MFSWFFICISCQGSLPRGEHLLCEACRSALLPAPPLCPKCGSPVCVAENKCENPWLSRPTLIQSYTALYLLIEPGYTVLKAWKRSGGSLLDRRILHWSDEARCRALQNFEGADAIVAIPQRLSRVWKLGRSPAQSVATWLSMETGLPIQNLLTPPLLNRSGRRQAERSAQERMENPLRFGLKLKIVRENQISSVILVDDFMTSGRTLKAAAEALRNAGVRRVDVFCLGLRPRLIYNGVRQQKRNLAQSRGGTVAIR